MYVMPHLFGRRISNATQFYNVVKDHLRHEVARRNIAFVECFSRLTVAFLDVDVGRCHDLSLFSANILGQKESQFKS